MPSASARSQADQRPAGAVIEHSATSAAARKKLRGHARWQEMRRVGVYARQCRWMVIDQSTWTRSMRRSSGSVTSSAGRASSRRRFATASRNWCDGTTSSPAAPLTRPRRSHEAAGTNEELASSPPGHDEAALLAPERSSCRSIRGTQVLRMSKGGAEIAPGRDRGSTRLRRLSHEPGVHDVPAGRSAAPQAAVTSAPASPASIGIAPTSCYPSCLRARQADGLTCSGATTCRRASGRSQRAR